MPGSPTVMRLKAQKTEKAVQLSKAEKEARKASKKKPEEEENRMGPWVMALLLFVVFGSSLLQVYNNVVSGVSMSEEH